MYILITYLSFQPMAQQTHNWSHLALSRKWELCDLLKRGKQVGSAEISSLPLRLLLTGAGLLNRYGLAADTRWSRGMTMAEENRLSLFPADPQPFGIYKRQHISFQNLSITYIKNPSPPTLSHSFSGISDGLVHSTTVSHPQQKHPLPYISRSGQSNPHSRPAHIPE